MTMQDQGVIIGYDDGGEPVTVACFGPHGDTKERARRFASAGNITVREYSPADPALNIELARWRNRARILAQRIELEYLGSAHGHL